MSEETKITESYDDYISMIQLERDGNIRICWKAKKPSTVLEISELPTDIKAHGYAFYGGVAKIVLESLSETADAVKIANEVKVASEDRVTKRIEAEAEEEK